MQLSQAQYADVLVASVSGRVDHAHADEFKTAVWQALAIDQENKGKRVLDLGGVDYISSAGLRVLMLAARRVQWHHGTLVLACLQPVVKEVFEITRFNLVFKVYDSVAAALQEISPAAAAAFKPV